MIADLAAPARSSDYQLFKFRNISKLLIESLVEPSLWFAKPNTLNDPFDCQLNLGKSWERATRSATGNRKQWLQSALDNPDLFQFWGKQFESVGVCSFSLTLHNSLLWSHYAQEHRGVSLLYRFPEAFFVEPNNKILGTSRIEYADNALTEWLVADQPKELRAFVEELTKVYLSVKSTAWAYEDEARIIRAETGLFKIPPEFLTQVCFGLNTTTSDIDLITKLAGDYCGCENFCRIVRDEGSDFGIKSVEL